MRRGEALQWARPMPRPVALVALCAALLLGGGCLRSLGFVTRGGAGDGGDDDSGADADTGADSDADSDEDSDVDDGLDADAGEDVDGALDADRDDDADGAVQRLFLGDDGSCAVLDGVATCWGGGVEPEYGGTTAPQALPLAGVRAVGWGLRTANDGSPGIEAHRCVALEPSGEVLCAGTNEHGQLGTTPGPGRVDHEPVPGVAGVVELAGGRGFTCARSPAAVLCWGRNDAGQLGRGLVSDWEGPGAVSGLPIPVLAITAGSDHACAIAGPLSAVYCWGSNEHGQVGLPLSQANASTPSPIAALAPAFAVTAGATHTCALDAGFGVQCWGMNDVDRLGRGFDGGDYPDPAPVTAIGGSRAQLVSCGRTFCCASGVLLPLTCWGQDDAGQQSERPPSLAGWRLPVEVGGWHGCALTGPREVTCWGANWAEQTGGTSPASAPTHTVLGL